MRPALMSLEGIAGWSKISLFGSESEADESLADFVRRRFGEEAVDGLAEPLAARNITMPIPSESVWPPVSRSSASSSEPMAARLTGLRATRSEARGPVFQTLRHGVGALIEPLAARNLTAIQTGASLTVITRTICIRHELRFATGESVTLTRSYWPRRLPIQRG